MESHDANSVNDRILRLVEQARKEAREEGYRAGYKAAIDKIVTAAAGAEADPSPSQPVAKVRSPSGKRRVIKLGKRAPWGAATQAMNRALDGAGAEGVDLSMVLQAAKELRFDIAESSARSILHDYVAKGELRRYDNGRWYRVARPSESGGKSSAARDGDADRAAGDPEEGDSRWNRHPDDEPRSPRVTDLRPGMPEGRAIREELTAPTRMVGT